MEIFWQCARNKSRFKQSYSSVFGDWEMWDTGISVHNVNLYPFRFLSLYLSHYLIHYMPVQQQIFVCIPLRSVMLSTALHIELNYSAEYSPRNPYFRTDAEKLASHFRIIKIYYSMMTWYSRQQFFAPKLCTGLFVRVCVLPHFGRLVWYIRLTAQLVWYDMFIYSMNSYGQTNDRILIYRILWVHSLLHSHIMYIYITIVECVKPTTINE